MSDTPDERPPIVDRRAASDTEAVFERAVERAATKVAEVAAGPRVNGSGTPVLSKIGSITAVAIIVIVELANLAMNITTKNEVDHHKQDFKVLCQAFVDLTPPERARDLAQRFAECIK